MTRKKKGIHLKQDRIRIFKDNRFDNYLSQQKYSEPTICKTCGALYKNGRWTWEDLPNEAHEAICPACQRIAENYPEGCIELQGPFLTKHREEILNLIRNTAILEQAQHPLERLMKIIDSDNATIVTTTGMHLARRIGGALHNAFQGEIEYDYEPENDARISWYR